MDKLPDVSVEAMANKLTGAGVLPIHAMRVQAQLEKVIPGWQKWLLRKSHSLKIAKWLGWYIQCKNEPVYGNSGGIQGVMFVFQIMRRGRVIFDSRKNE